MWKKACVLYVWHTRNEPYSKNTNDGIEKTTAKNDSEALNISCSCAAWGCSCQKNDFRTCQRLTMLKTFTTFRNRNIRNSNVNFPICMRIFNRYPAWHFTANFFPCPESYKQTFIKEIHRYFTHLLC